MHFINPVLLRHVSAPKGRSSWSRNDIVSQHINKICLFVFEATAPQLARATSWSCSKAVYKHV